MPDYGHPLLVVLIATCIGAATDVWRFRVYNALTIPLFLSGFAYHCSVDGFAGFQTALAGSAFGFAVLVAPYALGLMGAGDVKLLAGIGAWLGFPATAIVFVVSSLATGCYAVVCILMRGEFQENWRMFKLIFYRFATLGCRIEKDVLVEACSSTPGRRTRVVPVAATFPLGVLAALISAPWWAV